MKLCAHCEQAPVRGWRPESKFCSVKCKDAAKRLRLRNGLTRSRGRTDYPPHLIEFMFNRAVYCQRTGQPVPGRDA